jgi:hypothetical protein
MGIRSSIALAATILALGVPAWADQPESFTITNLNSASTSSGTMGENALGHNGVSARTFTCNGGYIARRIQLSGQISRITITSPTSDALLEFTPPGGREPIVVRVFQTNAFNTSGIATFDSFTFNLPGAGFDPAGTWTVRAGEVNQQASSYGPDARWDTLTIAMDDAAAPAPLGATDLGTVTSSASASRTINGSEVAWFRATLPGAQWNGHGFVDIDTEGSTLGAVQLVMFNSAGLFRAQDNGSGSGSQSQLTFGPLGGSRAAVGDGLAYDGRNGQIEPGVYWIAICAGPGQAKGEPWGWQAAASVASGTVRCNVRVGSRPSATPPAGAFDAGVIAGNAVAPPVGQQALLVFPRLPTWFKFKIETDARHARKTFLDIDCEGSLLTPMNYPYMAIWSERGVLIAQDNADGSELLPMISLGQTAPTRTRVGTGALRVGQDGPIYAGTYYLALAPAGLTTAPGADFTFTGMAYLTGSVRVYFKSNLTRATSACNRADVVGLGGTGGPDGQNTSDDLIAFLSAFFGGVLSTADLATLGGGAGPDGQITTDDLIFFLSEYFGACN